MCIEFEIILVNYEDIIKLKKVYLKRLLKKVGMLMIRVWADLTEKDLFYVLLKILLKNNG